MRIHILTPGFTTPNGCAFLFPIIKHKKSLLDAGYTIRFFDKQSADTTDCDALIIDSKFHKHLWNTQKQDALEAIESLCQSCDTVIFADTTDSAGWLNTDVLPLVDVYAKAQLYADTSLYKKGLYGFRLFADYYHEHYGVNDNNPETSAIVDEPELLNKLTLSWNSGLADYSWLGPYKMMLYNKWAFAPLLSYPKSLALSKNSRSIDMHCRMGVHYERASVAFQRKQLLEILKDQVPTTKVSRREYLGELCNSKIVVSPFGLGEITLKDFEVFLTGGLLLKPDMSHMQTWPNFYQAGKTMQTFQWDLSDITAKVDSILANYNDYAEQAQYGQDFYLQHTQHANAASLFVGHFENMVRHNDA